MKNLRAKTISGLLWSGVDIFSSQFLQLIFVIVLARIITPRDFGLIAMLSLIISISNSLIDSGFSSAIIQQKEYTAKDLSTVFFFNLIISSFLYILLFLMSDSIALFFNEKILKSIVPVLSLNLIITAISIIPRTILIKELNFKTITKSNLVSTVISGIISVCLALIGFQVWSLVIKSLVFSLIQTILFYFFSTWKFSIKFDSLSFKRYYNYGSKICFAGIIHTVYSQIYSVIIGKYFLASDVGFYSRADQFKSLASNNIIDILQRVTFPILSSINENLDIVINSFKKFTRYTAFISFPILSLLSITSESIILILLGPKWYMSAVYLKLLCYSGMLIPLNGLYVNLFKSVGRSDLFFKLEIYKKIIFILLIIVALNYGIYGLIYALIIQSVIELFINYYATQKINNMRIKDQIILLIPSLIISTMTAFISNFIYQNIIWNGNIIINLSLHMTIFIILYALFSYYFNKLTFIEILCLLKNFRIRTVQ